MRRKEGLEILLAQIGLISIGKQRWFEEKNGLWYDRCGHQDITFAEMIDRACEVLKEVEE